VPARFHDLVDSVRLEVLQPADSPFSCDELAFGTVEQVTVDASRVGESTIRGSIPAMIPASIAWRGS